MALISLLFLFSLLNSGPSTHADALGSLFLLPAGWPLAVVGILPDLSPFLTLLGAYAH